jgi:PAS domain S-box-containing protein
MKESTCRAFYHVLFDHAKFGIVICDFDGNIIDANPFLLNLLLYSKEEMSGRNVADFLDPDDLIAKPPAIEEILQGATTQRDRRVRNKHGIFHLYEIHAQKLDDNRVLILVHDISARHEAMLSSQIKYQRFAETSLEGIWEIDAGQITTFVNQRMADMLGYCITEMLGRRVEDFMFAEDITDHQEKMRHRYSGEGEFYERRFRKKNGEECWTRVSASPILDHAGIFTGSFGLFTDITRQRERDADIRSMAELLDIAPSFITVHDTGGNVLYANKKTFELHGYSQEEFVKINLHQLDVPESEALIDTRIEKIGRVGAASFEVKHFCKDGSILPLEVFVKPVEWKGRRALLSIGTDITERKKYLQEISNSQEKLTALINASPDIICFKDAEGRWMLANDSLLAQYGLTGVNYSGKSEFELAEFTALLFRDAFRNCEGSDDLAWSNGGPSRSVANIPDVTGNMHIFDVVKVPLYNDDGSRKGLVVFGRDITELKLSESALRESEQKYRQIAEKTSDVIWMMNREMKYTYVSPSVFKQRGYTQEEFLNLRLDEIYCPESYKLITEVFNKSLELGKQGKLPKDYSVTIELKYRCKDGTLKYSEVHINPVFDGDGNLVAAHGVSRDITGRKLAELALKESEDKFRSYFENAPIGIWEEDFSAVREQLLLLGNKVDKVPEYLLENREEIKKLASLIRIVDMNQSSVMLLGESSKESLIRCLPDYFDDESWDVFTREIIALFLGDNRFQAEIPIKTREGRKYLNLSLAIQPGHLETWSRVLVSFSDVTMQKTMEHELRNREAVLSRIFDILPVGLWFADKDGTLVKGNPAGIRIWGAEPLVSISDYGTFKARRLPSGEEVAADDWALSHTIREGRTITDELLEIDTFDGKKRTVLNYTAPIQGENGVVDGAVVVNLDITERRHAEENIRVLADFQSALLRLNTLGEVHNLITQKVHSLIGDGLVFSANVNPGTNSARMISWSGFTSLNETIVAMLGYDPTTMDFVLSDLDPGELRLFHSGRLAELPGGLSSLSGHRIDADLGRKMEVLLGIRKVYISGYRFHNKNLGGLAILAVSDISDKLGAIELLVNQANVLINRIKTEEALREIEERFRLAFLTSPDAVNINEMVTGLYVDVNEGFYNITGYRREEVIGRTAYEINIWKNPEDRARLVEILRRDGKVVNFEAVFRFRDGRLRTGLMSASIIQLNGVPHIISITRDIEELKEAEREILKAKEAAEEASRLKTAFLNNISHEVRTPMNSILGFTDLLQSDEFEQPEKDRFIGIIQTNGKQLLSIIDDVLEISRLDSGRIPLNPVTFHLHELMDDLHLSMKEVFVRKGLQFQYSFDDQGRGDLVIADREKIRQIIAGFITNAAKFTQNGMVSFGYSRMAGEIEFFVRDTGIGIPPAEHQRIFERFYQIQPESVIGSRGTGLGLSIARGLADFMKGSIRIDSAPGHGSTFFLTIPYEETCIQADKPAVEVHFSLQDLTILVAEDEDYNYELVEIMIGRKAGRMIRARNGEDVLRMLAAGLPDVVLMDLKMPVMDGYETTRKLRELHPDLPVIALTAYTQPEEEQKAMKAGCNAFLSKPIRKQDLIGIIQRTIKN